MSNKFALTAVFAFTMLAAACAPATQAPAAPAAADDPYAAGDAAASTTGASVEAADQAIAEGAVTIKKVNAAVDGFMVIHAQAEGKAGPVIGYTAVPAGESKDVKVEVDAAQATSTLYAMLHVDEGVKGTYEFPGADGPAKEGDAVVMVAFALTESAVMAPSVVVSNQGITNGTVLISSAYMTQAGWVVIHTEADGKPGPVIGYAALAAGESKDVAVEIDDSQATTKLFAMLHVDAGVVGTYEFPGEDGPVKDGDAVVMVPFSVLDY